MIRRPPISKRSVTLVPDTSLFRSGATSPPPELLDTDTHLCRFVVDTNGADTDFFAYVDGVLVKSGTKTGEVWSGTSHYRMFYTRYTGQIGRSTRLNSSH